MLKVTSGMAFGLGMIVLTCAGAARADVVKQQLPCAGGVCLFLNSGQGGVFTARNVNFVAPGAGMLIVSFHGSLRCTSNAATASRLVVTSQIVEGSDVPSDTGQSAVLFYHTIEAGDMDQHYASFSLNSHRVFKINAAGTHAYRFRVTRLLPPDTFCEVLNGTFTTDFRS